MDLENGIVGKPQGSPFCYGQSEGNSIFVFFSLDVHLSGSRYRVSRVVINEIVVLLGEVNNVQ